eukprot:gb/GECG01007653.1/.p1 GENE.gb/GECG01007653.1/~~gb/GECG01007653.1/.p1  ORF type:complete len:104 (+),score=14.65 gb/GECG01007653.1/:1-312(+)
MLEHDMAYDILRLPHCCFLLRFAIDLSNVLGSDKEGWDLYQCNSFWAVEQPQSIHARNESGRNDRRDGPRMESWRVQGKADSKEESQDCRGHCTHSFLDSFLD